MAAKAPSVAWILGGYAKVNRLIDLCLKVLLGSSSKSLCLYDPFWMLVGHVDLCSVLAICVVNRSGALIRRYADTPIRRYADTPLRRYAETPMCRYSKYA